MSQLNMRDFSFDKHNLFSEFLVVGIHEIVNTLKKIVKITQN